MARLAGHRSRSSPNRRRNRMLGLAALVGLLLPLTAVAVATPPLVGASTPGRAGLIAFSTNQGGWSAVWSMDPDGSAASQLTDETCCDDYPDWSPSGRRFAFEAYRSGDTQIRTVNADGTGQVTLTSGERDHGMSPLAWWGLGPPRGEPPA